MRRAAILGPGFQSLSVWFVFKFQYSTCTQLMFSVFVPILCARMEMMTLFLNAEYYTNIVIKCEICYLIKCLDIT